VVVNRPVYLAIGIHCDGAEQVLDRHDHLHEPSDPPTHPPTRPPFITVGLRRGARGRATAARSRVKGRSNPGVRRPHVWGRPCATTR
jgi:hypothetical protein